MPHFFQIAYPNVDIVYNSDARHFEFCQYIGLAFAMLSKT